MLDWGMTSVIEQILFSLFSACIIQGLFIGWKINKSSYTMGVREAINRLRKISI
jgi:hypothetical protein